MKKFAFGFLASVLFSMLTFAQEGTVTTSSFSQSKSDFEIPATIKSNSVWSKETANQFMTISIYEKKYDAFISLTLDIKNKDDVKIVSINAPKHVVESGSFNPIESLRKIPCWTLKCIVKDIIDYFHDLFN